MARVIVPNITAFDIELREALQAIEMTLNGAIAGLQPNVYPIRILGTVPTAPGGLPASPTVGDGWIANDTGHLWVWNGTAWVDCGPVRGPTGPQGPPGAMGPQGPPGVAGGAGDTYRHIQTVPATVWNIEHALPYWPNVTVVDSAGDQVEGTVTYPTATTVTLTFSAAFTGQAYLS